MEESHSSNEFEAGIMEPEPLEDGSIEDDLFPPQTISQSASTSRQGSGREQSLRQVAVREVGGREMPVREQLQLVREAHAVRFHPRANNHLSASGLPASEVIIHPSAGTIIHPSGGTISHPSAGTISHPTISHPSAGTISHPSPGTTRSVERPSHDAKRVESGLEQPCMSPVLRESDGDTQSDAQDDSASRNPSELFCALCLGESSCPFFLPCGEHLACHPCLHEFVRKSPVWIDIDKTAEQSLQRLASSGSASPPPLLVTHRVNCTIKCPMCRSGPILLTDLSNCLPVPATFRAGLASKNSATHGLARECKSTGCVSVLPSNPLRTPCPYGCQVEVSPWQMYRHVTQCSHRTLQCPALACRHRSYPASYGYMSHVKHQCTAISAHDQLRQFGSWNEYLVHQQQEGQRQLILRFTVHLHRLVNASKTAAHVHTASKESVILQQVAQFAEAFLTANTCTLLSHVSPHTGNCSQWDLVQSQVVSFLHHSHGSSSHGSSSHGSSFHAS